LNGAEAARQESTRAVLAHTLDQALRLLHPTMPFVTEQVWQHLSAAAGTAPKEEALIIAAWPKANKRLVDARAERDFALVMDIVRAIRNARAEFNVEPAKRIPVIVGAGTAEPLIASQREVIALLARLDLNEFQIEKRAAKPAHALALVAGKTEIYLPLAAMIDVEKEKARLSNETAKVRADIARAENLLAGEFTKRAPKEVVQKTRDTLAANRERAGKLDVQLAGLEGRAMPQSTEPEKGTRASKVKAKKHPNAAKKRAGNKTRKARKA
jgi:valyl-tRNA synthetase